MTSAQFKSCWGTPKASLAGKDVRTTMVYTHVLNRGPTAVRSPLDVDGKA